MQACDHETMAIKLKLIKFDFFARSSQALVKEVAGLFRFKNFNGHSLHKLKYLYSRDDHACVHVPDRGNDRCFDKTRQQSEEQLL